MRHLYKKRDIFLSELKFPWLQSFFKEVAKVPLKSECARSEKPNLSYFTRLFFPHHTFTFVGCITTILEEPTLQFMCFFQRMFTNIGFSHCWNQTLSARPGSHSTMETIWLVCRLSERASWKLHYFEWMRINTVLWKHRGWVSDLSKRGRINQSGMYGGCDTLLEDYLPYLYSIFSFLVFSVKAE